MSEETTVYRQQLRERILSTAAKEFKVHGIKAVKMDDIAASLGVSKRTLYEIFDNKEALLLETMKFEHENFIAHMAKFCSDSSANVIAVVMEFYRYQMERFSEITPTYFSDLTKYPSIAKWLAESNKTDRSYAHSFIQRGIEEGVFRSDVSYPLVEAVGGAMMEYVMKHQLYLKYGMQKIFHDIFILHIRGHCTLKGIEELDRGTMGR